MDLADLQRILLTECSLEPGRPLVAGVSGGPDSLCLLDMLQRLGYAPVVAHFDHQLRPIRARMRRGWACIAQNYGLPFVLGSLDVAGFARQHKLSIEEAARIARYRFLFETARQQARPRRWPWRIPPTTRSRQS